jgi:hypothetical protein
MLACMTNEDPNSISCPEVLGCFTATLRGGQAADQANSCNRAGAGDHERTSQNEGTQPVIRWVTLAATYPQPSSITELRREYSQSSAE